MTDSPKKSPKIWIQGVDPQGNVTEPVALEDLLKESDEAETRRKAALGDAYECRCLSDIRDPKCEERYPLACPWHQFQKFTRGGTPDKDSGN